MMEQTDRRPIEQTYFPRFPDAVLVVSPYDSNTGPTPQPHDDAQLTQVFCHVASRVQPGDVATRGAFLHIHMRVSMYIREDSHR
jgi:hypothetical protein